VSAAYRPASPVCQNTFCRSTGRMADMSRSALLTIRSKYIPTHVAAKPSVSSSLGPALRNTGFKSYPPPSTWAHPVRRISSSLAQGHYFRFGFGPIIRLHLRMEPLFLPSRRQASSNLHGSPSHCAFAHDASPADSSANAVAALWPHLQGLSLRSGPLALPIPSGGAFSFRVFGHQSTALLPTIRQFLPPNALRSFKNPSVSGHYATARPLHGCG